MLNKAKYNESSKLYFYAFIISLAGHLVFLISIFFFVSNSKIKTKEVVYTVSLEGGKVLGSLASSSKQIEKKSNKKPIKKVTKKTSTKEKKAEIKIQKAEVKEEKVVISKKEEKKKEPKKEVEKKKEVKKEVPKKKAVVKKVVAKVKKTSSKKPVKKKTVDIEKEYQREMQKYLASANSLGSTKKNSPKGSSKIGNGVGGSGILKSPEFFKYYGLLERHIRSGWNWHDLRQSYLASVSFRISPDGRISGIYLVSSSGNNLYDQSVLRAVRKASPVPIPPRKVYADFKKVEMDFTPE